MNWSELIKAGNFVYFKLPDDSAISRIGRIEKVIDNGLSFKIVDLISNSDGKLVNVRSNSCYPIAPTREMFDEIGFKEHEYEGGRKQLFLGSVIVEHTAIIVPASISSGGSMIASSFYEHDFSKEPISTIENLQPFLEEKRIFDVNDLRDRLFRIGYQLDLNKLLKGFEGSFSFLS